MSSTNSPMNSTVSAAFKEKADPCQYHGAYFAIVDSSMPYVVNAVLNVKLSVVATLLNALSFSAIRQIRSLHLPSKLLLCSLVLTDLSVGVVTQPLFVAFLISKLKGTADVQCILLSTFVMASDVLACTSVLLMTAISIDRYTALHFHIRYRQIVTAKRIRLLLVLVWLPGPLLALSGLWNMTLNLALSIVFFSINFVVMFLAYTKIYRELRQYARQRQEGIHGRAFDLARYRRSTLAMVWIKLVFILCYLPFGCIMIFVQFRGFTATSQCILEFSATIIHLNACLNPLTYALTLAGVRRNIIQRVRNTCG